MLKAILLASYFISVPTALLAPALVLRGSPTIEQPVVAAATVIAAKPPEYPVRDVSTDPFCKPRTAVTTCDGPGFRSPEPALSVRR